MFSLRFSPNELTYWASRYDAQIDDRVENRVSPRVRRAGFFTKSDFLELCRWKSPRSQSRCASNSADFIQAVTQTALSTPNEQLRIEVLTLLSGVSWPTASVVLHFVHQEPYPILDFRALWSLSWESCLYHFDFWWAYTQYCRRLAQENGVTMRILDRALWQYSKENQTDEEKSKNSKRA